MEWDGNGSGAGNRDAPKHLPDAWDINQVNENEYDMDMAGQQVQQSCCPGSAGPFPSLHFPWPF